MELILAHEDKIIIDGSLLEVTSEVTAILRVIYNSMKDEIGEDYANKKLVEIGRIAVMSDDELRRDRT